MNIKHKADAAPASCGQHTPLPWIYWQPGFYGEAYSIGPRGNCPILKTLGDNERVNEANAELVIRAVNSHQELLEALKAVSRLDYLQEHNALARQVKSAIAKAEGSMQ